MIAVAKRDTEKWLCNAREETVDIAMIVDKIQGSRSIPSGRVDSDLAGSYNYSLTQLCKLSEQKKVMKLMSHKEKLYIEAHSGQHHLWVN